MNGVAALLLRNLSVDALVELGSEIFRELARRTDEEQAVPETDAPPLPTLTPFGHKEQAASKQPPALRDAGSPVEDAVDIGPPPARQHLRGNVAATTERWKGVAADIAANGPQPITDLAQRHDLTYEGLSYGVRKGSFARWFTVEGGRVYLSNEGRQEALPPKE